MPARAFAIVTAMMDDHDEAIEGVADRVRRFDVGAHVLVAVLRAVEGSIERVDTDDGRFDVAKLLAYVSSMNSA
jgi:hypothetical protein